MVVGAVPGPDGIELTGPADGFVLPALRTLGATGRADEVADLTNHDPREGGMLAAGLFLQEFVPTGVRWAHLDIAGPAYHSGEPYGYTPHGGTGAAPRTLIELVQDLGGR